MSLSTQLKIALFICVVLATADIMVLTSMM